MSEPELLLDGRVQLHCGDSREVLRGIASSSIDSCVCDPPYALVSIVKRFGKSGAAPVAGNAAYARASAGFMGKAWDTGEVAFDAKFWREVLRVLKPGGHVVAFGGTRTYHRMAVAIEDAGFEIRDQLAWMYGTGFPKSHDVSKAIDKRKNWTALPRLQHAIGDARKLLGISQSEAARRMGLIGPDETLGGGGFMWFETGMRSPTREQWPSLKVALNLGDRFDECFEEAEREITGTVEEWTDRSNYAMTSKDGFRRDKPSSEAAAKWQGWGTALKPAWEPICLARKPLISTVADNVLQHGTGAINVGSCRIEGNLNALGRFPANILHDGSDEVVSAFPDSAGQQGVVTGNEPSSPFANVYGDMPARAGRAEPRGDNGSAARFFSAKADADDRLGSKHPTVKPVDLMQWLVRLVTPPGGLTLDPFAGTGTTGEAAWREGCSAVLVEREADYQADIRRRMRLALGGPDERRRESIKAKAEASGLPPDMGPLFSAPEAAE